MIMCYVCTTHWSGSGSGVFAAIFGSTFGALLCCCLCWDCSPPLLRGTKQQ